MAPQLALPPLTPVTKKLLIANGAIFVVWWLVYLAADGIVGTLLPWLGLTPRLWVDWFPALPLWQLGTYGFLHDVHGPGHIVMNMLMLYFFGTMLEGILGSRRFLVTYLAAMLAGGLLFLVPGVFTELVRLASAEPPDPLLPATLEPLRPLIPAIGASGAVYGIMVAVATMRPRQTVFLLFIPITMKWLAIGILALTLFGVGASLKGPGDGVAHLVHLGGIIYGFTAVRLGWVWRDPLAALEARRAIATEERRIQDAGRMDKLLKKIHDEGMSSLTRSEKAFLKRASTRDKP